jgi:DNA modification methylase
MKAVARLASGWTGSAWQRESTLHQLAPYIGKTKSSMAAALMKEFSDPATVVYDPFAGCGTLALEAWKAGRAVVANDVSPYAQLLTRSKLFPYTSLDVALADLQRMAKKVQRRRRQRDLRKVPKWVRAFFHPQTLKEALLWTEVLTAEKRWFLLACLMGILHHQRPGFLSFPSSHTVPYLRIKKFPRYRFRKLYEYRSVMERLEAKVRRAYKRMPELDFSLERRCFGTRAEIQRFKVPVGSILSSPPYMRQLDYGRDNRLRLWFLGCEDWEALDDIVSPREREFLSLMQKCLKRWKKMLAVNGYCVLVIGDADSREGHDNLPDLVAGIAKKAGFRLVSQHADAIPNERRVRRGKSGSSSETILVLRNSPLRRVTPK